MSNHDTVARRGFEGGQTLVLFAMCVAVILIITMAVVDVGFFLHTRQEVQAAADAAALAGAQELPDSPSAAEAVALNYVAENGVDPSTVTVSFRCTSQEVRVCDETAGTYDTIVVTPKKQAPSFFGGVLGLIGVSNCWVDGCDTQATAAGCRGACGPIGAGPVDAVVIIDRTGSMSSTDLSNAKSAAEALLVQFDPDYHHVGLGVLGPSSTSTTCGSPNTGGLGIAASSGGTWLPVALGNDYQAANGSINNNSTLVKSIRCLNTSSVGTDIGDPLLAATQHLNTSGRANVTHGIILMTDGAANAMSGATVANSTGYQFCVNQAAVTSSAGDNNGFQTNPSLACADGGGAASDANSGTGTSTSCTSTAKDKHDFRTFGLSSFIGGTGLAVTGIQVRLDGWYSGSATTRKMCVELSWNGGSSWTSAQSVNLSTSEATLTLGGTTNTWGRTWSANDFSDANFRVRVTNVANNTSTTFNLDAVAVNVHYTTQLYNGPCDYAKHMGDAAIAAGIELYVIAFGVEGDSCSDELPGTTYDGMPAADFLQTVAPDDAHYFNEPRTSDLTPIFQLIGAQLSRSSRLVQ